MAEGTSKSQTGTIVLGISTGLLTIASGYFGYKTWTMNKAIRELHDNINKAPANSVPANIIPPSLMEMMNKMK